jgi:hypothetical protein
MDQSFGRKDEQVFNSRDVTGEVLDRSVVAAYSTLVDDYSDEQYGHLLNTISDCIEQTATSDVERRTHQLQQYRVVIAEVVATLEDKIETLSRDTLIQQKTVEQAKLEYATKILDQDSDEADVSGLDVELEECRRICHAAIATIMNNDKQRVIYQAYKIGYDSYDQQLATIESQLQEIITHIGAIALHYQALSDLGNTGVIAVPPTMKKPIYETMDFSAIDEDLGLRPKDNVANTYITLPEMPSYVPVADVQTKTPEAVFTIDISLVPSPRLIAKRHSPIEKLLNQGKAIV